MKRILISCLILFLIVDCTGKGEAVEVERVAHEFAEHFTRGDFDKLDHLIAKDSQAMLRHLKMMDASLVDDITSEIRTEWLEIQDEKAKVKVYHTLNGREFDEVFILVKEDEEWKVRLPNWN